jgi:hypothetical protein
MLITAVLALALQEPTAPPPAPPIQRVAWYTSLEQAMADGERLNRPILLQSAAPQCGGVPGMW